MDFNTTIDLIIKDLREASEIIDDLKKYQGVPLIQVELAKSKCRSAAEVIALLKTIKEPVIEIRKPDEPQPQPRPSSSPQKEEVKAKIPTPEVIPEPLKEEKAVPLSGKQTKNVEPEKKDSDILIVADKFEPSTALYEEQAGNLRAEKDLSDRLKVKQITSLSTAIGISDKFLFMGEIFDGNKENYAQAISKLDNVGNVEEARSIIISYTGDKPETDAVNQLLELVKLKLQSNE